MPGLTWSRTISIFFGYWLLAFCSPANAQIRFDLPSQSLAQSLTAVGSLSNLNVYYDPPLVRGIQAPALKAELTPDDALSRLLVGTHLHAVHVDANTVRVIEDESSKRAQSSHDTNTGAAYSSSNIHLAYAGGASDAVTADAPNRPPGAASRTDAARMRGHQPAELEEVLVTAQKRTERLQDVPVPVTAVSAQGLIESNQLRLQDYYTSIPGLSVTPNDFGTQLTIRGLTTGGYTNPTVGITVDDVPFGSSSSLVLGTNVPDFDPSDLARVEVLRGPQGTLYGASSLGGLVKYATKDPSPDSLTARLQSGFTSDHNGEQLGYNVRGALNVPVDETFAVRMSGFYRKDPGYIDNPILNLRGVNDGHAEGGRVSALWRPFEALSVKLSAMLQHALVNGSPNADLQSATGLPLGDLRQDNVRGTGGYDNTTQVYSAVVSAKLGPVNLTSVTGYSVNRVSEPFDFTPVFGFFTQNGFGGFGGFGVTGTVFVTNTQTRKFTQELRLSGEIGRAEWLLGGFYNHEDSPYTQDLLAEENATGRVVGSWVRFDGPLTFAEYAVFTDVTYHFTDDFSVQVGGRESQNKQVYNQSYTGVYAPVFLGSPSPFVYPREDAKGNSFTYLVTPQFKISPDLMVYGRLASGYRAGGPNVATPAAPTSYKPDTTQNYEIGVKGDFLDRMLSVDASVYYINWKDVQLQLRDPLTQATYYVNGSRAKSQGVELSLDARPLKGLRIGGWVAWNDAELTQDLPKDATALGVSGDRLPYSARFSGNLSLQEEVSIAGSLTAFFGGTLGYVGSREGVFLPATRQRQLFPAYAKADLRAGLEYDSWTGSVYVNNVADRRGVLSGGLGTYNPYAFDYIQPRTVGVNLVKNF